MTELTYTKNGDYRIPDLKLSEEPESKPLGKLSPTSKGRFPDAGNLPVRQVCINAGIACQV